MRLRATKTLLVEPALPPAIEPLRRLAHNLHWTWHTDAAALFERMGRDRWEATGHNPVRMLQSATPPELAALANDDGFLLHLNRVANAFDAYMARPPRVTIPGSGERAVVAYFSLEFALTESLPNYSGGLGVLAGDHLKSASDLGLPLVGVGLLYREGYFQQALGPDGWQREEYTEIDMAGQPVHPVLDDGGAQVTVAVPFDGRDVVAAVWRIDVGRTPLYVLDTDVEGNSPIDRKITSRLYGGDIETRIQQEMILGIGGVRALHAIGLHPVACHMNEGHSALLGADRIRMFMEEGGNTFDEALLPVSAATVFTTHTAVAAGIDLFPPELVRRHLGRYYYSLGIDDRRFLGLGRINPDDDHEPFSMALLGLRLSGYRNGVSRLHRTVSRNLWESAWPRLPVEQIPIDSITNGVHLPTWVSHGMADLFDRYVGHGWRDDPVRPEAWQGVRDIPNGELWDTHESQRHRLIIRARNQHRESAARRGLAADDRNTGQVLDIQALTIGFARRFAGYKRATLLFRDPERLARIINAPGRPAQFIFAGKAHPRDEPAKQLIREVVKYSRMPEFRDRLVILERYDVELARALVQGCDIWLNTPLRPLEASGTSGMKAVANGALHMSVMDGWWAEAARADSGWSIGRDRVEDDPEVQDAFDSESIYDLLENEIIPAFYERDEEGVPNDWVALMKNSIANYAPVFSTHRMVSEYASTAYAPAAASWTRLRSEHGDTARDLNAWLARVRRDWDSMKICAVDDDGLDGNSADRPLTVTIQIHPGALRPDDLDVDVVFGVADPTGDLQVVSDAGATLEDTAEDGICRFVAKFPPSVAGRAGYAVRVLPGHPALHNPFDLGLVSWG